MKILTAEFADKIAQLVIDKSYWGNDWYVVFSILIIGLIAAASAAGASYLTTKYKLKAEHAEFETTLDNLKVTTDKIKGIEEKISHDFLEKRELSRIKREKIEEIYTELNVEYKQNSENLLSVSGDGSNTYKYPTSKVDMLISLYFQDELLEELDFYREKVKSIKEHCVDVSKQRLEASNPPEYNKETFMDITPFFKGIAKAKEKIEIALEYQMKKLNSLTKHPV